MWLGPCVRRGGYNSGVPDSTNKMNLFTECGINSIAIHSKWNAGTIAIRASRPGLVSAAATLESQPFEMKEDCRWFFPALVRVIVALKMVGKREFVKGARYRKAMVNRWAYFASLWICSHAEKASGAERCLLPIAGLTEMARRHQGHHYPYSFIVLRHADAQFRVIGINFTHFFSPIAKNRYI